MNLSTSDWNFAGTIKYLQDGLAKVKADNGMLISTVLGGELRRRDTTLRIGDLVKVRCSKGDIHTGKIFWHREG